MKLEGTKKAEEEEEREEAIRGGAKAGSTAPGATHKDPCIFHIYYLISE